VREGLASHTEKRAPRFDGPTGERGEEPEA
jgi:hypothetical protein